MQSTQILQILICTHFYFEITIGIRLTVRICDLWHTAAAAKSLQLYPTLCDPRDSSPPGSPVPGILQARTLEWVAISFSNAGKWKVKVKSLSRVRLLATPWTAASQAPPSMGFSRQEYWSGVPFSSPGDLPDPGIEPGSPALQADAYAIIRMLGKQICVI